MNDIEIASKAKLKPIEEIAEKAGLSKDEISPYGRYIAKIEPHALKDKPLKSKMVLITAMTPTPAGEGKTTVSIGLSEALNKIGKKSIVTLREPSLGPVFGVKGGATGGGYSQVLPMAEINLHFTGDIHAVTAAHNLLSALVDNEYSREHRACLLPRNVLWNRVIDMNDRALRNIVIGLGKQAGMIRESRFEITASSEIMAILALSRSLEDLKKRLGRIIVAESSDGKPIYASDFKAEGALAILLKDAIKPNLVQTIEGNPAIIHAGPFANIAHGTNSIAATEIARKLADIVVIESGFASDLGGEKFFNLVSRQQGMTPPDAVVIVATVRALKYHGGVLKKNLASSNVEAVGIGFPNLAKHIENMKSFGRPVFVALNTFATDTDEEIKKVVELGAISGTEVFPVTVWSDGGNGAISLAGAVFEAVQKDSGEVNFTYNCEDSIPEKIEKVVTKIYGGAKVVIPRAVERKIELISSWGYGKLPICMAKTQSSLSDNPDLIGRPEGFTVEIRDVKVNAGAGFVVVFTSDIMTMPGLPPEPAAYLMDISEHGEIKGLF